MSLANYIIIIVNNIDNNNNNLLLPISNTQSPPHAGRSHPTLSTVNLYQPLDRRHVVINLAIEFQMAPLVRVSEALLHPSANPHHHIFTSHFHILEIVITRLTSKTDQQGAGTNYSFRPNPDPSSAFDFVMDMFLWTQLARPDAHAPFISYRCE